MNELSKFLKRITDSGIEEEQAIVQYCEALAATIPYGLFVWDLVQKRFCYIKPDDLFLCGHSVEEAMGAGADFFSTILHPEDLPLWKSFLESLPRTLRESPGEWSDYFGLFRLLRKYPFIIKPVERYRYHRFIPIHEEAGHSYLIGIVSDSECKKVGCYRNGTSRFIYQAYNPKKQGWQIRHVPLLNRRELEVLEVAIGERDLRFIADELSLSYYTIRSHVFSIRRKLKVQDLWEATDWISYLHILRSPQEKEKEEGRCSPQNFTFNKKMKDIQILLDEKQSIRSISILTGRPESTIRSWISRGFLKK